MGKLHLGFVFFFFFFLFFYFSDFLYIQSPRLPFGFLLLPSRPECFGAPRDDIQCSAHAV